MTTTRSSDATVRPRLHLVSLPRTVAVQRGWCVGDECIICHEALGEVDELGQLRRLQPCGRMVVAVDADWPLSDDCGHLNSHHACLERWLRSTPRPACPTCRQPAAVVCVDRCVSESFGQFVVGGRILGGRRPLDDNSDGDRRIAFSLEQWLSWTTGPPGPASAASLGLSPSDFDPDETNHPLGPPPELLDVELLQRLHGIFRHADAEYAAWVPAEFARATDPH